MPTAEISSTVAQNGIGAEATQSSESVSHSEAQSKLIEKKDRISTGKTLLYLYSGPYRADSVAEYIRSLGSDCMEVDIEAKSTMDLLDCDVWQKLLDDIRSGKYFGIFASPPCCTFSVARKGKFDRGPCQLRGADMPQLYKGVAGLTQQEREQIKIGNVLADRAAEAVHWFAVRGYPWAIEQPARREGNPSMFNLPKFELLRRTPDACFKRFAQCNFGCEFQKSTEILGNIGLDHWPGDCCHPTKEWIVPWSGVKHVGPHPPLRGRQKAIPAEGWVESMLREVEPPEPFLTKSTAHYPGELNRAIAEVFHKSFSTGIKRKSTVDLKSQKTDVHSRNFSDLPIPKMLKHTPDDVVVEQVVGGLRKPYNSLCAVPGLINLGVQVRNCIKSFCERHPGIKENFLNSVGHAEASHFPGGSVTIDQLRSEISSILIRNHPDPSHWSKIDINESSPRTCLKANFLRLWAECAGDPGAKIVPWLIEGAPGGIELHPDLDGLFPRVPETEEIDPPEELFTDFDSFKNYEGVEDNPDASEAIQGYVKKGYLSCHDTLEECRSFLGGSTPVLSKLGCIVKVKENEIGQVIKKTRIILDAKQSRVTKATERRYKSELPRIVDAVHDILELMSTLKPGEVIMQMVADVVDAFWLVPLHQSEMKYFTAKLGGKYMVFLRTAQGSRAAPLTFAAVMALAARLLQSLLLNDHLGESIWQDGRLETYVDDPWLVMKGNPQKIEELTLCVLIGWELMGFPLAYHKAAVGVSLKWIGMTIEVNQTGVAVSIPTEKLVEIRTIASDFLKVNVVPDKELRSFIGKCMSIASVLHVWKPFIAQFYAALYSEKSGNPKNCTWTSQIRQGLHWILAFLDHNSIHCLSKRTWDVVEHMGQGDKITITWDASPWGFGGTLHINGIMVEYLYGVPTEYEIKLLELEIGEAKSQQTMEALGGLVSLRQWSKHWQHRRAMLLIRSDNVGALVLFGQLNSKATSNGIIAREAALDFGNSSFSPRTAEHVPGVTNVTCDSLSRIYQPGGKYRVPEKLRTVPRADLAIRDETWWKSVSPPLRSASHKE